MKMCAFGSTLGGTFVFKSSINPFIRNFTNSNLFLQNNAQFIFYSISRKLIKSCGINTFAHLLFQVLNCSSCVDPGTYGRRSDPWGHYVKRYVPEIAKMPVEYVYEPWKAPLEVQARSSHKRQGAF